MKKFIVVVVIAAIVGLIVKMKEDQRVREKRFSEQWDERMRNSGEVNSEPPVSPAPETETEVETETPAETDVSNESYGDPIETSNSNNYEAPSSSPANNRQSQWINCDRCHGGGLELCYKCGGKGQGKCSSCHGTGTSYATSGAYTCNQCNGRGIANCSTCYSKGNMGNCRTCRGRGQVLVEY